MNASAYPSAPDERSERVTEEWLKENEPDYSNPWQANSQDPSAEKGSGPSRSTATLLDWYERIMYIILRNPIIPLVVRTFVWIFSLIAMALGSSIYRATSSEKQTASPEMAIIVDAIALVYTVYITYDEYTGKPLGLRSAKAKLRLIFMDLFFIVFSAANLSLAFEAQEDVSDSCPPADGICRQQKALASVLLITLVGWLMTFSVSVLRYELLRLGFSSPAADLRTDLLSVWFKAELQAASKRALEMHIPI